MRKTKIAQMAGEMEIPCCVRGYHVYKEVWEAGIGEVHVCSREPSNATDRYAVAVTKGATVMERPSLDICQESSRRCAPVLAKRRLDTLYSNWT